MESKTVLVTGGAGFIGSHLILSLRTKYPNWKIINLDKLEYPSSLCNLKLTNLVRNYRFIEGDICDQHFINCLFATENIDIVFHFAAETHVDNSFLFPSKFMAVNAEGTRVLLSAALETGIERFIYVSTDEVYGASSEEDFDESCLHRPTNPYAVSKATAENIVMSFWEKHKLPIVITRSNNVYGPRQHYEKIIPRFISLLSKDEKCTIQGSGLQSRHFLFVDDAMDAFLVVMEQGIVGEIYNIGTNFEITVIQLARELVRMMKHVPEDELDDWLLYVKDRPINDLRYPINSNKLCKLGWKPKVSWSEGIRRTVQWYEDNPDVWPITQSFQTTQLDSSSTCALEVKTL
ncbi:dTDP-D-glucose 4,6-dehydratase-like [Engraulis encrasicolus]|uniref:dTDP-D-glucose 4,6-dehydratase-like n=1 Tax=Engraulis encrasicolus TaxID=184585 RepID=UPI002FD43214